jgi:polyphenol oxidase
MATASYRAAPVLPPPFEVAGEHIAIALPGGRALFTTRRGGTSEGPYASLNLGLTGASGEPRDHPARVRANRERLAQAIGIPWERVARGRQVHGTTVHRVEAVPHVPPSAGAEAQAPVPGDGQATTLNAVPAVVLVADCLPIALMSPGAVAMLHAGWRGLAGGIVAEGVLALGQLDPGGPVSAAIGPGIGGCCYEVGDEVVRAFGALGPPARVGNGLDLKLIARRLLADAGVGVVHDVGLCTACSDPERFFSHRRDRGVTGRQGGAVWRS